ncbi:MAG TPA: glycosyltransferase family 39 protein, partial [Deltaproteobacteria bacterium]|nr:glycosyltransferase family 39 protein [Deltaproteobacteria bacterium]
MSASSVRVLFLALLIQCVGIADHSLWTPDEPREAQIVREMSLKGDYLIPSHAGRPFLEKPPLYYIVATAAYRLFGGYYQEAGRFASLLFAFSLLLAVYAATRSLYGDEASVFAPLILATFPLFFLASHKMLVDMGLVFFITAAMCSFLLAFKGLFPAGYKVFWLCLVLAFLTKGIVGLAIPGAGILVFMLWQRDMRIIRDAWIIQGVLLVFTVMLAWGLVLYLKGGTEFLYTFYIYNHLGRFIPAGTIYQGGHVRDFSYYLLNVPLQTAPWSLLLVPAVVSAGHRRDTERFLYSWLLGGLLLLSISSTKREIYFLPMFPALAVIIAGWMARSASGETERWEEYFLLGTAGLMLIACMILPIGYVKIGGGILLAAGLAIFTACMFVLLWRHYGRNLAYSSVV